LVFGGAAFVGGLGRQKQTFSATGASAKNLMLLIAVAGMVMPAVYDLMVLGSLTQNSPALESLSVLTAIVLLLAYVAGLIFSLRTHSDIFTEVDAQREQHETPELSVRAATATLLAATILTAVVAELLVG